MPAATGAIIGMHSFGASAPIKDVMQQFGFMVDKVVDAAKAQIEGMLEQ